MARKIECDRCGTSKQETTLGSLPEGWERLTMVGEEARISLYVRDLCTECVKVVYEVLRCKGVTVTDIVSAVRISNSK